MGLAMYGIRNCDTVRKARAWLEEHGHAVEFHDYKLEGVRPDWLQARCRELGWEQVLNRAGPTFRKLPDEDKADLDEAKAIALMQRQPSMIKRPLLQDQSRWLLGYSPERYEAFFAGAATAVSGAPPPPG